MIQLICDAINSHHCIEFTYDDNFHRVIEPHAYGEAANGNELVRGYQIAGSSESGKEPPWRLFSTDKMTGLRTSEQSFRGTRPLYNPGDPAMEIIYCYL